MFYQCSEYLLYCTFILNHSSSSNILCNSSKESAFFFLCLFCAVWVLPFKRLRSVFPFSKLLITFFIHPSRRFALFSISGSQKKSVSAFIQNAVEAGLSAKNSGISTNDFRHLYFVEALLLWQAHQLLDDENEFKAVVTQCKRKAGIQHD